MIFKKNRHPGQPFSRKRRLMDEMETQPDFSRSDREIIQSVIDGGDEGAFREIYRRHTPRLLGFVFRLLGGTEEDAEDVVQETWIRACNNLPRFQWKSSFSTWLLGIGLNVTRDHLRKVKRSEKAKALQPAAQNPPRERHEERIDLERCIRSLPDRYRMILVLYDVEGMKHREIAEHLGITTGTSKSQLSNARRMLREMLSREKEIDHE
jgi:RNA polymerase sigma factor (sigma-70 family)